MTQALDDVAQKEPIWSTTAKLPTFPKLNKNVEADVAIVGAGIAGLSCGYMLMKAGKTVAIVDDGAIASGMTQVTTAHLANAIDDRYYEVVRLHGERGAQLAAESHTAAINRIEMIVREEGIDCDFSRLDGYLFLSPGEKEELLEQELAAAHQAGLNDVTKLSRVPLECHDLGPCLRFPNQGQFHPLKYLAGLAKAIKKGGGKIFTKSHADRIEGGPAATVQVGEHVINAAAVIVATNSPINDLVAIHTKQAPYMTYAIGARVPRQSIPTALYWDTGHISKEGPGAPYHYVRLQPSTKRGAKHDVLIVGGEDHKSGQADDTTERHRRLESWARERFPMMLDVEFVWGGQVMETMDGLAFIGRNPLDKDNVFVVTGDSGMGMTHGVIAGILLTDLILGRENPWMSLYDPSRKTLRAAGEFAKENINVAAQYADWVTPGEVSSPEEIEVDSGAVMRRGLSKIAVYRDQEGTCHEMSAVCGHLGCIVHWNGAEKSWDCPCHGSRFDKLGKVINGPANSDLPQIEG